MIYNFPLEADGRRYPPEAKCRVFRSEDAGQTWQALSDGLPTEPYYPSVLRDAMCADDAETAASTSAPATATSTRAGTRASTGSSSPRTCRRC